LIAHVEQGGVADAEFFLSCSDDPLAQTTCAETFSGEVAAGSQARLWTNSQQARLWNDQKWKNSRIRLAYLLEDFNERPTASATATLLESHDRSKFEVIGFAIAADDEADIRTRIQRSCDQFYDVVSTTDSDVAKLINNMEVDILVDRSGYRSTARAGIAVWRPSPIQVNLGFPGSLGSIWYDYIIADPVALPFDQEPFYPERLVYLPDCCVPVDSTEILLPPTPTRQQMGLPAKGLVFCCFNKHFQIRPPIFDIWMSLLRQIDWSALWLLGGNQAAEDNLRKTAAAQGIDPARLVFAPKVKAQDHQARHRLADLFLDTSPYGDGAAVTDALLSGVPAITCLGSTFAGRGAGSLLAAFGLPELAGRNLEEYEAIALRLANEPALLQQLRDKLKRRPGHSLPDIDRYRRQIEAAYTTMWELWQNDEDPRSFGVVPTASR
jgi:protein O-GlcNAc transferase